jgi:protein-disulfide isomerase
VLPAVLKMYPGKVSATFWHNPLDFHPMAEPAARAAMAAQLQGRFWELHDLIFKNQKSLSPERLVQLAGEAGLDVERFTWDMEDARIAAFVSANAQAAAAIGIKGTPMFLINGKVIRGAQPPEKFKEILDVELKKAEEALAAGVPREELARKLALDNGADETYLKLFVDRDFSGLTAGPGEEKKKPSPSSGPKAPPVEETVWKVMVRPGDPAIGPADAPLTVVAFSEFQCPYCAKGTSLLQRILEEYKDEVRVVFKNFPLPFHKDAMLASEAALAAHAQGKFWDMHDLLFENQRSLSQSDLEGYGEKLGLDMTRFKADLASHVFQPVVERSLQDGRDVGVKGTPNYFINGRVAKGAVPFDSLKSVLEEELKKGRVLRSRGDDDPYNTLIKKGKVFVPFDEASVPMELEGAPSLGPADAELEMVVFSDFQCPFCQRFAEPAKELQRLYKDRARLVFMQFPLPSHSNAHAAAEAVLAAHAQGKFWEMHDLLFENRQDLSRSNLDRFAEQLGLDMERFSREMNQEVYKPIIQKQMETGKAAGVNGTPTLVINGHKYLGASKDPKELSAAIDSFFARP